MPKAEQATKTGVIKNMNPQKGFGFIRGNDSVDYFFHRSAFEGDFDDLQEQDTVAFEPTTGEKGPRAEHVSRVA